MHRVWLLALVAMLAGAVLATGCSGEETSTSSEESPTEQVSSEEMPAEQTSAEVETVVEDVPSEGQSTPQPEQLPTRKQDEDREAAVGEVKQCQIDLAVADVGTAGVERLVFEWTQETFQTQIGPNEGLTDAIVDWAKPARPIGQFFADKGYVC